MRIRGFRHLEGEGGARVCVLVPGLCISNATELESVRERRSGATLFYGSGCIVHNRRRMGLITLVELPYRCWYAPMVARALLGLNWAVIGSEGGA